VAFEIILHRMGDEGDGRTVLRLLEEAWDAPPDEYNFTCVRRGIGEAELVFVSPGESIEDLGRDQRRRAPRGHRVLVRSSRSPLARRDLD